VAVGFFGTLHRSSSTTNVCAAPPGSATSALASTRVGQAGVTESQSPLLAPSAVFADEVLLECEGGGSSS
jgi:hypothetical protein